MRPLRLIIALVFLAAGAALGALNAGPVMVDLGVVRVEMALGVALLASMLVGVLAGGLALAASVILPLRRERDAALRHGTATPQGAP
jgi:uncharacterized integral membrane protein